MSSIRSPCLVLALCALPCVLASTGCRPDDGDALLLRYDFPAERDAPWPQARRTRDNRGHSPVTPSSSGGARAWFLQTDGGVRATPIVGSDDVVYLAAGDGLVYAATGDGAPLWTHRLGAPASAAPALDATGTLFVASTDGTVHAIRPDGTPRWRLPTAPLAAAFAPALRGAVVLDRGGELLVGRDDGALLRVSRDGELLGVALGDDAVRGALATDDDNARYFGALDGTVRSLSASGDPRWSRGGGGGVLGAVALTDELAVFGGLDGAVYGVARDTGEEVFRVPTRGEVVAAPAVAADGTVYAASTDGALYALTPDGQERWRFHTLAPLRAAPVVDGDGTVYVGGGDGTLYAVRAGGQRAWSFSTGARARRAILSGPVLGRRAVYFGGPEGRLYGVPYDYCFTHTDVRCDLSPGEPAPADLLTLAAVEDGGRAPPGPLVTDPGGVLTQRLLARADGEPLDVRLDAGSLQVELSPPAPLEAWVSAAGDRLIVAPEHPLAPGGYTLRTRATLIRDDDDGGEVTGTVRVRVRRANRVSPVGSPQAPRDAFVLERVALTTPSLLASLHDAALDDARFLVGVIGARGDRLVLWAIEARADEDLPRPHAVLPRMFAFSAVARGNAVIARSGPAIADLGRTRWPLADVRLSATLPRESERKTAQLIARTTCADLSGDRAPALRALDLCGPDGRALLAGHADLVRATGHVTRPALSYAELQLDAGEVIVRLFGDVDAERDVAGVLVLDADDVPLPLDYGALLEPKIVAGQITEVRLRPPEGVELPDGGEIVGLVNLTPVGRLPL